MIDFNYVDKDGNSVTILGNEFVLFLKEKGKSYVIGQLLTITKPDSQEKYYVYKKKEKEAFIFKKLNAWSINAVLLHLVDGIWIETEKAHYKISKKDALASGQYLHFKGSDVEKKLYVPLQYFKITQK